MPIIDDTPTTVGVPVLTRTAIGQKFVGVTCQMARSRDRTKTDPATNMSVPLLKPNGKPRQELVVHLLTIESTMPVGKVGEHRIPEVGEHVRAILKGQSYGDWIDANKALGGNVGVGYIVTLTVTHGQQYDENGKPLGGELLTQAECDAVPRGRSLGYYGALTIHVPATPDEIAWDTKACQFYNDSQRPEVPAVEPEMAPF